LQPAAALAHRRGKADKTPQIGDVAAKESGDAGKISALGSAAGCFRIGRSRIRIRLPLHDDPPDVPLQADQYRNVPDL